MPHCGFLTVAALLRLFYCGCLSVALYIKFHPSYVWWCLIYCETYFNARLIFVTLQYPWNSFGFCCKINHPQHPKHTILEPPQVLKICAWGTLRHNSHVWPKLTVFSNKSTWKIILTDIVWDVSWLCDVWRGCFMSVQCYSCYMETLHMLHGNGVSM